MPSYNLPTEKKPLYCSIHKLANMIDVKSKRCIYKNCMSFPAYNFSTEKKPLYCNEHKLANMINVIYKRCMQENCMIIPRFNIPTENTALYCKTHKLANMIDIKSKRCIHDTCMIQPLYNNPTEKTALYCKTHKLSNMINVIAKRCIHEKCMDQPHYNIPTEKKPLYCNTHKLENMIDIISKRCIHEKCMMHPSYNLPTESKPLYCNTHKLAKMINIKYKRCIHENCISRPYYNIPTENKPLYCSLHKKENMISTSNKNCQHSKCKEQSLYGIIDKRPQYCVLHKQINMINLILENKCCILECNNEYEHEIEKIKYCNTHIPDEKYGMIVKRLCRYCDIKEDAKFVCKDCKKIQNKKEWGIVRHLRTAIGTKFEYNTNKMLQGCSLKRPDIYFELPLHCVIVEIDENQHKSYEDICECARINEIVYGIGGLPVIIIRYNPDIVKNNGIHYNVSASDRIDLLVNTIKNELVKKYDTFIVKIIQVYYNDNYDIYQPIKEEIITDKVAN